MAAKLGDSDQVDVGDEIFVIGAPYGISRTLTAGHISGRRTLNKLNENTMGAEFLQTDAAINSGNSGSPMFNLKGEVVGIVSNIMSRSGGSEGLAFAATSNTARRVLLEQKPKRVYERAYCKRGEIENRLKELHHRCEINTSLLLHA